MPSYNLRINGFARSVDSPDPEKPLLYVLRGLGLTAAKFGCGLGQCGACTVLLDGKAIRSCQTTIANAQSKTVTTLEGLGSASAPHPIQAAFIKEQVPLRLLHERHDHERGRAVGGKAEAQRGRHSLGA